MAKIKINNLPLDSHISAEDMRKVFGGVTSEDLTNLPGVSTVKFGNLPWAINTEWGGTVSKTSTASFGIGDTPKLQ